MSTEHEEVIRRVRLAFSVPKGFEDVAWQDIQRFVPTDVIDSILPTSVKILSGFVFLRLPIGPVLELCLETYANGHFWAVTGLILSLDDSQSQDEDVTSLPVLPENVCSGLEEERRELPSKRSRQIIDPDASKKRINRYRRRIAPLDMDTTPNELAFLDFLTEIGARQRASHELIYNIWKKYKHPSQSTNASFMPSSFAMRFERRDFMLPTLKSSKVAYHLAELYGTQLTTMFGGKGLKADLLNPDYEIVAELIQSDRKWNVQVGIILPPAKKPTHRPAERLSGRTTMLPERAYCFCQLHPALQEMREAKSRKAMVFLDPCAGFGSIPLELSGISKRDNLNLINLAADNELPSLEKALENAVAAHAGAKQGLSGMDASLLWTGYGIGHSGGFREGVLDGIIADLPWGIRELSAKAISTLYPALLRFLGHATANGAYGIFLCWREKVFLAAVKSNDRMWEVTDHRTVDVEGVGVHVFTVIRKQRDQSLESLLSSTSITSS